MGIRNHDECVSESMQMVGGVCIMHMQWTAVSRDHTHTVECGTVGNVLQELTLLNVLFSNADTPLCRQVGGELRQLFVKTAYIHSLTGTSRTPRTLSLKKIKLFR